MQWMMCLACGTFVEAVQKNGTFELLRDACPACDGSAFKHNATGTRLRAGE